MNPGHFEGAQARFDERDREMQPPREQFKAGNFDQGPKRFLQEPGPKGIHQEPGRFGGEQERMDMERFDRAEQFNRGRGQEDRRYEREPGNFDTDQRQQDRNPRWRQEGQHERDRDDRDQGRDQGRDRHGEYGKDMGHLGDESRQYNLEDYRSDPFESEER